MRQTILCPFAIKGYFSSTKEIMKKRFDNIPKADKRILEHPYVGHLHDVVSRLVEELTTQKGKIEELEAELRRLKKLPKKPKIEASKLDEEPPGEEKQGSGEKEKRPGSEKRKKKKDLPIDEYRKVKVEEVEPGWRFSHYQDYVVQSIEVARNNICYQREVYLTPEGGRVMASLPAGVQGHDFGEELRRYVIHLYNECHVTQPLIYQHLTILGVDISKGQVNNILNEDPIIELFTQEMDEVFMAGVAASEELRTDDTSAPHQGRKEFCNCINTDFFTYFSSSAGKSRINFLQILQGPNKDYHINEQAIAYCERQGLTAGYLELLRAHQGAILSDTEAFECFLKQLNATAVYAQRTLKEGGLIGSLVAHGFDPEKIIHSDGAGQFDVFCHALCWKHAERPLKKLHIHNPAQQVQYDGKMNAFWHLYRSLKAFKALPPSQQARKKQALENRFDKLCKPVEGFAALNLVLEKLQQQKNKMLLVLDRPVTSMHNNASERDIREYAKRRKISGSTRSEKGRKARDTFTSLKKTCQKLEVSFWDYLLDRLKGQWDIPPLAEVLHQRMQQPVAAS